MRAALLMRMLCQKGVGSVWYRSKDVEHYRCVVVRKRYDDDTLAQLRRFKENGGQVVLDLCDNHFVPASKASKHLHQVENLRRLVYLADAVVTSAESLAAIVRQECPDAPRVLTIGDVPDDLSIVKESPWRRLWRRWKIRRELNDYWNRCNERSYWSNLAHWHHIVTGHWTTHSLWHICAIHRRRQMG
jgi:hypothetical protein